VRGWKIGAAPLWPEGILIARRHPVSGWVVAELLAAGQPGCKRDFTFKLLPAGFRRKTAQEKPFVRFRRVNQARFSRRTNLNSQHSKPTGGMSKPPHLGGYTSRER
jgi:hypothetical protein